MQVESLAVSVLLRGVATLEARCCQSDGSARGTIGKLASDVKKNFRKPTFDHSANEVCSERGGYFRVGCALGAHMPI